MTRNRGSTGSGIPQRPPDPLRTERRADFIRDLVVKDTRTDQRFWDKHQYELAVERPVSLVHFAQGDIPPAAPGVQQWREPSSDGRGVSAEAPEYPNEVHRARLLPFARSSSYLNPAKSSYFARHVRRLLRSIPAAAIAQMRGHTQEMGPQWDLRAGARSS
jgi:hypothetical protein